MTTVLLLLLTSVTGGDVLAADPRAITVTAVGPLRPYMDMIGLRPHRDFPYDANGIVLVPYGGTRGNQYNPVTVAQQALGYYHEMSFGRIGASLKAADRADFFNHVEWLVKNQEPDGRWLYHFPMAGMPLPWQSAMAEGQAMSVLIRAHRMKPDARYLSAIRRARSTFERFWDRNGVATAQPVGTKSYVTYEEYMAPYSLHTLNGWIFAMVGLYEDWVYLKDPMAQSDLYRPDRGLAALRALLPYYDTGKWSTYNLLRLTGATRGTLAHRHYHELHVKQLTWLTKVTGDPFWDGYAQRWTRYLEACTLTNTCPV
jgi:hypothetical protein